MPPRYQARPTDLLTRVRNEMDALGRPGMAGTSRLGGNRGRGFGQASVLTDLGGQDDAAGQGQLLILSATSASIDSGGDYVTFDDEVYRHGFDGYYANDSTVAWPATFAGGSIQAELAWDSFEGGGKIEIEVDGAVPAWGLLADATVGREGCKRRSVHINAGSEVRIKVTHAEESAQIADVWVEFSCPDPADQAGGRAWFITDPIASRAAATTGEVFHTTSLQVDWDGVAELRLANRRTGLGQIGVDNGVRLTVTHADASESVYEHVDLESDPAGSPFGPVDVSSYFEAGDNSVLVELFDEYGTNVSSTEMWLVEMP